MTTIRYRLPITVVRFTGHVTVNTNPFLPRPDRRSTERIGAAAIVVRADPRTSCSIEVTERDFDNISTTFDLLEDGRLTGAAATFDARGEQRISAVLGATAFSGAVGMMFGGPVGAVLGAGAGAVAAGAALGIRSAEISLLDVSEPSQRPAFQMIETDVPTTPEALGIVPQFEEARPADFERLFRYRRALFRQTLAHARLAEAANPTPEELEQLRTLTKMLKITRAEARAADDVYVAWLETQIEKTVTHHEWELRIDLLPTTDRLRQEVGERLGQHRDADPWWTIATTIGMMVTCDVDEDPAGEQPLDSVGGFHPSTTTDGTVFHRHVSPARLTTWRLTRRESTGDWDAHVESFDRVLVTLPESIWTVKLPLAAKSDATMTVGFAESGALTRVAMERSGRRTERMEMIAGLPTALSGAVTAGSGVGTAFSPAVARAAALKRELEEIETRNKIQGLLNPTPDEHSALRKQLAEAELQARLAIAQQTIVDPTSMARLVRGEANESPTTD